MGKKLPYTPNTRIKAALHKLFLRSRERAAALKRTKNTCTRCGVKASKATGHEVSIQVHHVHGIQWAELIDVVRHMLLCDPEKLVPLCKGCHEAEHDHVGGARK